MIIATFILAIAVATVVAWPTIEDFFYTGQHRATPHDGLFGNPERNEVKWHRATPTSK